jgi:hypothetical protein
MLEKRTEKQCRFSCWFSFDLDQNWKLSTSRWTAGWQVDDEWREFRRKSSWRDQYGIYWTELKRIAMKLGRPVETGNQHLPNRSLHRHRSHCSHRSMFRWTVCTCKWQVPTEGATSTVTAYWINNKTPPFCQSFTILSLMIIWRLLLTIIT